MPAIKSKHTIAEVDGKRCTIVESDATEDRVKFLRELLEFNKYEVIVSENASDNPALPKTFSVAVPDILFNPVIAIYERTLKTPNGFKVTPAFWMQYTTVCNPAYYHFRKKNTD